LCRDEAQKLWAERAALAGVGLKVGCVVHEWIEREVGDLIVASWRGLIEMQMARV
jgi:hypothetical protein